MKLVSFTVAHKFQLKVSTCNGGLTTLAVESFFKGMRADHDIPTVLQYGYKRARCVQDNMMRIYQRHFSYFTCPNSFYPERIINSDPPDFGLRQTKQMATHEGNQELTV